MKHKTLLALIVVMGLLSTAGAVMGQRPTLASVNSLGNGPGNGGSGGPTLSANGRYLVFSSYASDLAPNDTNGIISDVFVRDLMTGTTTLVSVNTFGTGSGNGQSGWSQISADGRFVLFVSEANDLVLSDDSSGQDIFIRDLLAGTTTRIRASNRGFMWNQSIQDLHMTPDGQFVVFSTLAKDLIHGDTNNGPDVFVYDINAHTTSLVSVNMDGIGTGNNASGDAVISDNGRFVAFVSSANNLVPEDGNGTSDVFVRDLVTGVTTLVSVNYAGTGGGNQISFNPRISADGRKVAFISWATDLSTFFDANSSGDIFVRDLTLAKTTLVSVSRRGRRTGNIHSLTVDISANGRFVIFSSWAKDLTRVDPYNGINARRCDLFLRDLEMNTTTNLSAVIPLPVPVPLDYQRVFYHRINSDARFVVFDWATEDIGRQDVYVVDVASGEARLMNVNLAGNLSAGYAWSPAISADGQIAAFTSNANDLVLNDTNNAIDVFTFSLLPVNERPEKSSPTHLR